MIVNHVMTDHPSWISTGDGAAFRAVRSGPAVWVLTCDPVAGGYEATAEGRSRAGERSVLDAIDPACLTGSGSVADRLRLAGTVGRWRNPDLWDALATAIVRQVIRAAQARKLYRRFCQEHGDQVLTPYGQAALFPTPETVLELPDAEYARLGLAFKCQPCCGRSRAGVRAEMGGARSRRASPRGPERAAHRSLDRGRDRSGPHQQLRNVSIR